MTTRQANISRPKRKKRPRNPMYTRTPGDYVLDVIIYASLLILVVVTLYPFVNIIAVSFNDAMDSLTGGITIFPRDFTVYNYQQVFNDASIVRATSVSIARTLIGAFTTTASCFMVAYALSRKEFVLRAPILKLFVFTMYFSGGLIPYYLLMKSLGLIGSFWVYIFPSLVSAWNIMVMRSYIENSVPDSLIESARIDGSSEFTTLVRIVLPLSIPIIATVLLWSAVGQWNSWFDAYLYNGNRADLSTLQFELQKLLQRSMMTASDTNYGAGQYGGQRATTPQATRAAMTVVATVPILIVYPFLQRYFVSGLTLGGVKG